MSSSLDNLIKNIPNDNKVFWKSLTHWQTDTEFEYMNKKGYFPYEWLDSIDKLKLPITELKKEQFNNRLKSEALKDDQWDDINPIYWCILPSKFGTASRPHRKGAAYNARG